MIGAVLEWRRCPLVGVLTVLPRWELVRRRLARDRHCLLAHQGCRQLQAPPLVLAACSSHPALRPSWLVGTASLPDSHQGCHQEGSCRSRHLTRHHLQATRRQARRIRRPRQDTALPLHPTHPRLRATRRQVPRTHQLHQAIVPHLLRSRPPLRATRRRARRIHRPPQLPHWDTLHHAITRPPAPPTPPRELRANHQCRTESAMDDELLWFHLSLGDNGASHCSQGISGGGGGKQIRLAVVLVRIYHC